MRKIVYYVASSLDGFIAGPNDDISAFAGESSAVSKYFDDLEAFDTVIMGRRTYEFGYRFGLQPGQPAYPHMKHYIFSKSLRFETQHENINVCKPDVSIIQQLRSTTGSDIYLCGGGQFAGWLLDNKQIDLLKIKLNPLILGKGIRIFGDSKKEVKAELIESLAFDKGIQIMTYQVNY